MPGSLSHPNIAQVFDYGEARGTEPGYLVMELVEGLSLTRILDDGPLPPGDVMDVVAQAARGLAAAHQAGLVHRDIKPGNLLVRLDGLVKITDFGIATAAGENPVTQPVTQPGMLIGTPAYLAPERISGAPAMPATDLYALGVVAHQCLTGQVPFVGEPLAVALAHLDRGIPPLPPSVPPAAAALVADLTRQDPAARPGSAWDVAVRAEHLRVILSSPEAASPGDPTTTLPARADGAGLASPAAAGPVAAGAEAAGPTAAGSGLAGVGLAGPVAAGSVLAGSVALARWRLARRELATRRGRRRRTGRPASTPRPARPSGSPAEAPGPARPKASLPVRGALLLTGVASVGFISWTLATLPSQAGLTHAVRGPAGVQPERRAEPAAPAEPGRGHAHRRSRTAVVPTWRGRRPPRRCPRRPSRPSPRRRRPRRPHRPPRCPRPRCRPPRCPRPRCRPHPCRPPRCRPHPCRPRPVPTTAAPTTPIGSLTPTAPPTDPALVSDTPAPLSLLSVQIVP